MDKMEAAEMLPTVETYNSIIYAFSEASEYSEWGIILISLLAYYFIQCIVGDAVAAEYYFWEMKRKGFTPNL